VSVQAVQGTDGWWYASEEELKTAAEVAFSGKLPEPARDARAEDCCNAGEDAYELPLEELFTARELCDLTPREKRVRGIVGAFQNPPQKYCPVRQPGYKPRVSERGLLPLPSFSSSPKHSIVAPWNGFCCGDVENASSAKFGGQQILKIRASGGPADEGHLPLLPSAAFACARTCQAMPSKWRQRALGAAAAREENETDLENGGQEEFPAGNLGFETLPSSPASTVRSRPWSGPLVTGSAQELPGDSSAGQREQIKLIMEAVFAESLGLPCEEEAEELWTSFGCRPK
jgi:hypothetical protein